MLSGLFLWNTLSLFRLARKTPFSYLLSTKFSRDALRVCHHLLRFFPASERFLRQVPFCVRALGCFLTYGPCFVPARRSVMTSTSLLCFIASFYYCYTTASSIYFHEADIFLCHVDPVLPSLSM